MRKWNYADEAVLELKYEACFAEPVESFVPLFEHYGFSEQAISDSRDIIANSTFQAVAGRKPGNAVEGQVTRSGAPGQWAEYFTPQIKEEFKLATGDLLQLLQYETSNEW